MAYNVTLTNENTGWKVEIPFDTEQAADAFVDDISSSNHPMTAKRITVMLGGFRFPQLVLSALMGEYRKSQNKVAMIKSLREMTGYGLKETKDFCYKYIFCD